MAEIQQTNFWSGITNDERSRLNTNVFYMENFVSKGKTLRQIVNNQAEDAGSYDKDFYITRVIQVGTKLYGLGQDNETNNDTTLFVKTNVLDSSWAIATNGTIAGTTFNAGNALLVHNNGIIYLDGGNSKVAKYVIGTTTMTPTSSDIANAKGGVVWQGNIYCWSGQSIFKIDVDTDTATDMKTVSTEQTMVELVPYGNLLAVVCTSVSTKSKMFLWDGVSTTVWVDILEIGLGTVSGGALLENTIVMAINTPNKRTLKLKGYSGVGISNLFTYTARKNKAGTYNYAIPASSLKTFTGYIYFIITGTQPNDDYANIYQYSIVRYGREEPINPATFSIYKTLDFTSTRTLDGQTANNDFTIIESIVDESNTAERAVAAFINSASGRTTFFLSSSKTYSAQPGVIETVIFNNRNSKILKETLEFSVQTRPLLAAGQVTLKYKKDGDTAWTTIFTNTLDDSMSHEATTIEGSDISLPHWKELRLRIECLGGVELLGYSFEFNPLESNKID